MKFILFGIIALGLSGCASTHIMDPLEDVKNCVRIPDHPAQPEDQWRCRKLKPWE